MAVLAIIGLMTDVGTALPKFASDHPLEAGA